MTETEDVARAKHIEDALASAPPLSESQRISIARLLADNATEAGAA